LIFEHTERLRQVVEWAIHAAEQDQNSRELVKLHRLLKIVDTLAQVEICDDLRGSLASAVELAELAKIHSGQVTRLLQGGKGRRRVWALTTVGTRAYFPSKLGKCKRQRSGKPSRPKDF
jgi:hypothetical protein